VADWATGAPTLDDGAGVRRWRPMATDRAATVRDSAATSERDTFLAEDSAVSPATRSGGRSAAANARGRRLGRRVAA
jgi:hypothetical protein